MKISFVLFHDSVTRSVNRGVVLKLVSEAPKASVVECDEMGFQLFPSASTSASSSGDDSDQSIQSLASATGGVLNLSENGDILRNHLPHHHSSGLSLERHGIEDDDEVLVRKTGSSNDCSSSLSVHEIGMDFQNYLRLTIKSPRHHLHHNHIESSSNYSHSNSVETSQSSHSPSPPQPIILDDDGSDDVNHGSSEIILGHVTRSKSIRGKTRVALDELHIPPSSSVATNATTSAPPWDKPDLYIYNPFGSAFHGYLNHSQTKQRLMKDGQYLVRKQIADEDFVLSVR